jgi:hypothetical protein
LAFAVTVTGGVLASNPIMLTLERGLLALFFFCLLGLVLGWAARLVLREYEQGREAALRERFERASDDTDVAGERAAEVVSDGSGTGARG